MALYYFQKLIAIKCLYIHKKKHNLYILVIESKLPSTNENYVLLLDYVGFLWTNYEQCHQTVQNTQK